jgi:hypothetical protein
MQEILKANLQQQEISINGEYWAVIYGQTREVIKAEELTRLKLTG